MKITYKTSLGSKMCSIKYLQFTIATILLTTILTSCMVGPNFHSPLSPATAAYTHSSLPTKTASTKEVGTGGKAQYFNYNQDIPAEWWTLFHSIAINNLIKIGMANSPNLAAAQATLIEAQETLVAQIGATLIPAVNAQLGGAREKINGATSGINIPATMFNLYNASVNVSYTFDVFGGARREIESLQAQVDNSQYQLLAANLTLTSNIVTTAINMASLQAQIKATKELIRLQANQLKIVQAQFTMGGVSGASVLSQQSLLAQTQASLPPLESSLAQSRHALAVLIGALPSEADIPSFDLNKLTLPTQLPLSLPSLLIRQRPDVLASEALLHSASAQVGVATANLFPQFNLSSSYGWQSLTSPGLFTPNTNVWDYGLQILAPVFAGGSLQAKKRAAIAAYQVALAQYRQTVLQAFQNVADSLRALEADARTLKAQRAAEVAAFGSLVLTQQQFKLGGVSYLSLLTAEQQYQQARISRIQAQGQRYADTAALFQALGGGWWNTKPCLVT
jgi:NodT family efflux transporter outer membrane factor (OMF) lipoprotein